MFINYSLISMGPTPVSGAQYLLLGPNTCSLGPTPVPQAQYLLLGPNTCSLGPIPVGINSILDNYSLQGLSIVAEM